MKYGGRGGAAVGLVTNIFWSLRIVWNGEKPADVVVVVVGLARSDAVTLIVFSIGNTPDAVSPDADAKTFFFLLLSWYIYFVACFLYFAASGFCNSISSSDMHRGGGLWCFCCCTLTAWFRETHFRWNYISDTSMSLMIDLIKLSCTTLCYFIMSATFNKTKKKRSS